MLAPRSPVIVHSMAMLHDHSTQPGRYLTDGTHLFRLVTPPERPPFGGLVELEDSRSLQHVLLYAEDLWRMRRVVPDHQGG
jgi:hypothetical protein